MVDDGRAGGMNYYERSNRKPWVLGRAWVFYKLVDQILTGQKTTGVTFVNLRGLLS